ncbi:hypothetical protein O9K51_05704 [Purpureocillium lavendulum]|uniref:Uncharacterized protein n=1 Tax=Purpureocillium lavendulum TaxID=1247861 RepID=A0AB34FUV9_9HYPO|nr:hypothetical protein O9K51_05704 [Purpureocillium lavendulum]
MSRLEDDSWQRLKRLNIKPESNVWGSLPVVDAPNESERIARQAEACERNSPQAAADVVPCMRA